MDEYKFEGISNDALNQRIRELEEKKKEVYAKIVNQGDYHFRAHEENGMEGYEEDEIDKALKALQEEISKIKNELKEREDNPLRGLSDQELEEKKKELYAKIVDQDDYHFRAHEENGMEGYEEDEIDKALKKIQNEIDRRKNRAKKDSNKKENEEEIEKPEQPMMILEDPKKGKNGPEIEKPEQPMMILEDKKKSPQQENKSKRHWVEIMAETQTKSSGSISTYLHNMGKIKPFRMGITLWAAPVKLAMKGIGKLTGDVIGRAESKKEEMKKNIEQLSPEEFEILVDGLTETNVRQYKVNEIYLEAVHEVLSNRENAKKQQAIEEASAYKEALDATRKKVEELKQQLKRVDISEDKKLDLQIELQKQVAVEACLRIKHNEAYDREVAADTRLTNFERAKSGKSTQKMNIQGWFAGKFNPDNRELHQQMAEQYRLRREAQDAGNLEAVNHANQKLEELKSANTKVIQLLPGKRFATRARINRGKHTVEEVHQKPNDATQTKAMELIATAMAAVTVANVVRQARNNGIQEQIDEHNQAIDSTNQHNQEVQSEINQVNSNNANVQAQVSTAKSTVTESQLRDAATTEVNRNNALNYATRHEAEFLRTETPGVGFNKGGSDSAIHAEQSAMTQARMTAENGSLGDMLDHASATSQATKDAINSVLPTVKGFTGIPGKSQFGNAEYVTNLEAIVNSQTDSLTLLQQLFEGTGKIGDIAQVTGTIQQISPFSLQIPTTTFADYLPFAVAMANIANLEAKKAQITKKEDKDQNKGKEKGKDKGKKTQEQEKEQE